MNIPDFINVDDWRKVVLYSLENKVNPYLIAAIGWHETQWGKLGWGKQGFILGVGCFSETNADYSYQGLDQQLRWASIEIGRFLPFLVNESMLITFAEKVWRPGNPKQWGKAVFGYWIDLMNRYGSDLFQCIPPFDWAIPYLRDFYLKNYLNTPFGDYNFYRLITILGKILKEKGF